MDRKSDTTIVYPMGNQITHQRGYGGPAPDTAALMELGANLDNLVHQAFQRDLKPRRQRGTPSSKPLTILAQTPSWMGGYLVEIRPSRENLILINSLSHGSFNRFMHAIGRLVSEAFPDAIVTYADGVSSITIVPLTQP